MTELHQSGATESPNLRAERLDMGLSQRAAAERIGISQAILLRAEAGLGVRPEHAKLIADFYGFRVRDIWPVEDRTAA
jgi:transcriptional regulator with XRE-family HTH domain